ncbi:MAG: hypothetical protein VKJ64_15065 [Leptolyngbyaceae bacterium]|nr:hypothetical protein [Leptolyngbyaceae bacterium]
MSNIAASFTKLCESYIDLAERFQRLDIEHMTLKEKLVPLLKTLQTYRGAIATLQQEKQILEHELHQTREACNILVAEKSALKALDPLLSEKVTRLLAEVEEQMELVNETICEIELNDQPNLSIEDKALLARFNTNPGAFMDTQILLATQPSLESGNGMASNGHLLNGQSLNGQSLNGQSLNGKVSNGQSQNGQSQNGSADPSSQSAIA